MAKARPGRRVEFRLPEDHPFFTVVPLGIRQEWLTEIVSATLLREPVREKPNPEERIRKIEEKVDQILCILTAGPSVNQGPALPAPEPSLPEKRNPVAKPKPAIKNPRALVDF